MIPAIVIFTYILMGNTLDIAVSLIAMTYFERLISIFT